MKIFFFLFLLPIITIAQTACNGTLGDYFYSLEKLAMVTQNKDIKIKSIDGSFYYYRPCYPLINEYCQLIVDDKPATCMKDTRKIPQFHSCGSTQNVTWSPRNSGNETGFIIKFIGGEEDRMTNIEFICDETFGIGSLQLKDPVEKPKFFYHFYWRSSYVCPINK
jgi:hypothetical protein